MEAGSPVDDQAKALFGRTIFEIRGAYKHFGGAIALNYADFTLKSGEIHALLGENGAGKSTLLKVLAGVHTLEAGTIALDGKTFIQGSPRMAMLQGVTVIYQEPSLFPDLTLTENVYIGRQLRKKTGINWAEMKSKTKALFDELGVQLDPSRVARGLSIADQQVVEIAKALSLDARIILMDEPTAALTKSEVNRLMLVMRRLQEKGKSVVFVSHRLDEVFAICDQITVMRDGATVAQSKISDTSINEVIKWMVGRELKDLFPKMESEVGEVVLEVEGLSSDSEFADITLNVRRGEIVALAGLVGSGRSEVARAIFGIDSYQSGTVKLNGKILPGGKPAVSVASGLALVPEDRRQQGLFMSASVSRNIAMEMFNKLAKSGLISQRSENSLAQEWGKKLQIKYPNPKAPVDQLSGGNQQKTVLAKWFATNPDVLIVDEPTRGIDVQTKAEFHRQLSQAAASGKAILMISSELPEVLGMADRIYVMHEGRLVKELSRHEATQELIMTSATGQGGDS